MREEDRKAGRVVGVVLSLMLAGCGSSGTTTQPPPGSLAIAAASPSGDGQVGPVGAALPQPLRVKLTRDGVAAAGELVIWQVAGQGGSVAPTQSTSGVDGIASTSWTLGTTPAQMGVTAYAGSASGPSSFFSAIGAVFLPGPTATVLMKDAGGSRFEPAFIVVPVGTTVTWTWSDGQHDLTPTGSPTFPGDPTLHSPPRQYQFTFTSTGTYNYYCANHGTPTTGMRGSVIVQ